VRDETRVGAVMSGHVGLPLSVLPRARRRLGQRVGDRRSADSPVTLVDARMTDVTLYDILEVSPKARPEVIRAAYRCLVQQYHPDRNAGDPRAAENMYRINQAYSVLADPLKRARYDEALDLRAIDRRGRGRASQPSSAVAGGDRPTVRRFAFRPID
jgi:hypothetical protein